MRHRLVLFALLGLWGAASVGANCGGGSHEPVGHAQFTSPQVDPIALSADGTRLFVANTTSNSVDVLDTGSNAVVGRVDVGLEPVTVAVRPGTLEVWVSNHVSDSVSVIDTDPASDTYLTVVRTIQAFDAYGATRFDEPTGIAFTADGATAYVALSSVNDIAILDAASYSVVGRFHITAQEPRDIAVVGDRLYVAVFESFNQTELSACPEGGSAPQCTLDLDDLADFVIQSPNIPGSDSRLVKDPDLAGVDRDVYVLDISSPQSPVLDGTVNTVGTLLYGLAADAAGNLFVSLTDARNDVNGGDNGNGQNNLVELDNRMFLNQVARIACPGGSCGAPTIFDLEPLPPSQPAAGTQLARPYGIAVSGDGSTVVATAAGTSRLFTLDAATGAVRDIQDLDDDDLGNADPDDGGQQIPKGVALRSDGLGAPDVAYVLNTLENTVSVVDVSDPDAVVHLDKIPVGTDPTPDAIRRGRIAFNNAFASDTGTFSCAGCHPDGNTDQLLWRIGGPCFIDNPGSQNDCNGEDEIRSTMPVRGLENTLPLHWDGTLGDPFDNTDNGAFGLGDPQPANCTDDQSCFEQLVNASLGGVMCDQTGTCDPGGSQLSGQEITDMAVFLQNVSYPPARSRRLDDTLSRNGEGVMLGEGVVDPGQEVEVSATKGFTDFWMNVTGLGTFIGVMSCADMDSGCHALPLGVDHSSSTLAGFDAPTMRGLNDRTLQFSIGITNAEEVLEFFNSPQVVDIGIGIDINTPASQFKWDPDQGFEELATFSAAFAIFQPVYNPAPMDMFQMVHEASTGHAGTLGRQVTVDQASTVPGTTLPGTEVLVDALELADQNGQVNLRAVGSRDAGGASFVPVTLSYRPDGTYKSANDSVSYDHAGLIAAAQAGTLVVTLTGHLPANHGDDAYPMPLLSVTTTADANGTNPAIPMGENPMTIAGIGVRDDARVYVDGVLDTGATVTCQGGFNGTTHLCDSEVITVTLTDPGANGAHLLQLQNPKGPMGPEFPYCPAGTLINCTANFQN